MNNNKVLRIPRSVLAQAFDGDNQAIKAMEGLQTQTFDITPSSLETILVQVASVIEDSMQASIIANQVKQEPDTYLQAVQG